MKAIVLLNLAIYYFILYNTVFWLLLTLKKRNLFKIKKEIKEYKTVEIIIPAYNEENHIRRCIESAINIDYPKEKLKITVINDGSTDRTLEVCKEYAEKGLINLVDKKNTGKANSMNIAIGKSKAELIACMDADSFFDKNTVKEMVGYFEDDSVGAVTPSMKTTESKTVLQKVQWVEYMFSNYLRALMGYLNCLYVTPGPGSMYRKEAIIDGFDESNLTEDTDIALRIHKKGYKIANTLHAVTYTETPDKLSELFKQRKRWYVGYFDNIQKHKDILLKKEFGELGMWFLPTNFIWLPVILLFTGLASYEYISNAYRYTKNAFLIDFNIMPHLSKWIAELFTLENIFNPLRYNIFTLFNTLLLVFAITSILLGVKFSGERIRDKSKIPNYIFYVMIYGYIMSTFWFYSIVYKITKWNREELRGWEA
ncbi:MAG: glycosyltransferase [Candidatus Nanoarchaeia archaeon]|nr:glycosyltransferase [Candidatus Nanoarchaeia archaeon]